MRRNGNFSLETDFQALDTDLILDLKKTSLKNQMKTKQISFMEYYRGYMRWETYRWSKNVINHVGPQVDQVQLISVRSCSSKAFLMSKINL